MTTAPDGRRFAVRLAAVAVGALAMRVGYVLALGHRIAFGLDALWYELVAGTIASGDGYVDPATFYRTGVAVPTAFRPPLYPGFLAVVSEGFGGTRTTFQVAGCLLGTLTVVLVGLLGRRVGGPTVGLCAAALAAGYPVLVAIDASNMSEALYVPLVAGALLAAFSAIERPTAWRWALLGVLVGAGALTRADGVVLVPALLVPAALRTRVVPSRRLLLGGVAVIAFALTLAPWLVRNQVRIGRPALATLDGATVLAGANCDATYGGAKLGSWEHGCTRRAAEGRLGEVALSDELQGDAVRYALDHKARLPLVAAVRFLRLWGAYDPLGEARQERVESRIYHWQVLSWATYVPVALLAVYGTIILVRRRVAILPLVAVMAAVTATGVLAYGKARLRATAEPALLVAASVAVVHLAHRWAGRGREGPALSPSVTAGRR